MENGAVFRDDLLIGDEFETYVSTAFKSILMNQIIRDEKGVEIPLINYIYSSLFSKDKKRIRLTYSWLSCLNPRLAIILYKKPRECLKIFNRVLQETIKEEYPEISEKSLRKAKIQMIFDWSLVPISTINQSESIGEAIRFQGVVVRMTPMKQILKRCLFECEKCGRQFFYEFDEFYTKPRGCPFPDCENSTPSKIHLLPNYQEFEEYQELIIQEFPENFEGSSPPSVRVIIRGSLTNQVKPGDRVEVSGIILTEPEKKIKEGSRPIYNVYIEAVDIDIVDPIFDQKLTNEELNEIQKLKEDPDFEQKIYNSIAPSIYGLDIIKKAIAAQLFGGVSKVYPDGTKVRGDIHILLIGDPGMAKSQLLKYVSTIAPRAIYTSGKGTSAAGLTAAVIKTESGWTLEAGVLVLADKGIACIDEFDKMNDDDRKAIHEALEQQTVSIAKAGIVATLNARTSVLAGANPKYGRYRPDKGLKENIDLPPPILSRFDLIFIIKDEPNEAHDKVLAEHILDIHSKFRNPVPPIDVKIFRKLIVYARNTINPKLSKEAIEKLKEFYLEMRRSASRFHADNLEMHPVPITPRHLEALVRLTEAHARMLLKEVADEKDAEFAIQLMAESLRQVAYDVESGVLDVSAIYTGETFSQRSKYMIVLDIIKHLRNELGEEIPLETIIERCSMRGITREFVLQVIQKEKERGEIIEKRPGFISVL